MVDISQKPNKQVDFVFTLRFLINRKGLILIDGECGKISLWGWLEKLFYKAKNLVESGKIA